MSDATESDDFQSLMKEQDITTKTLFLFAQSHNALCPRLRQAVEIGKEISQPFFAADSLSIIVEAVKTRTSHYDASHDMDHFVMTAYLGLFTLKTEYEDKGRELVQGWSTQKSRAMVFVACLYHEVLDHKYNKTGSPELEACSLSGMLKICPSFSEFSESDGQDIVHVITNSSYSKEKSGVVNTCPERLANLRQILVEADSLDATGFRGIFRVCAFTGANTMGYNDDIHGCFVHCHEKLKRLFHRAVHKTTKLLAIELLAPILFFVAGLAVTESLQGKDDHWIYEPFNIKKEVEAPTVVADTPPPLPK